MQTKLEALAKFLDVETDDLAVSTYDDCLFELGSHEYLILTDEKANERLRENVEKSAWAFNASFIIDHSDLPAEAAEMVGAFQESKCEDANDTILALINDMDRFASDAASADGRGHFLSGYDGEENQEGEFYIYRTN